MKSLVSIVHETVNADFSGLRVYFCRTACWEGQLYHCCCFALVDRDQSTLDSAAFKKESDLGNNSELSAEACSVNVAIRAL